MHNENVDQRNKYNSNTKLRSSNIDKQCEMPENCNYHNIVGNELDLTN